MARFLRAALSSPIGGKVLVAAAGLLLCGFLVVHLYGNLFLFAGEAAFNAYSEALEKHVFFVRAAELGLLILFLLHAAAALALQLKGYRARPVSYAVRRREKKDGFGSKAMFPSAMIILAFLAVHLRDFRFSAAPGGLFALVVARLSCKPLALFYAAAMAGLGFHLSHGFQSAFHSLGINHPKATPAIKAFGLFFALVISGGFSAIPLWICFLKP